MSICRLGGSFVWIGVPPCVLEGGEELVGDAMEKGEEDRKGRQGAEKDGAREE